MDDAVSGQGPVYAIAFSADGKMIAAATTDEKDVGRVQLWHLDNAILGKPSKLMAWVCRSRSLSAPTANYRNHGEEWCISLEN